MIIAIELLVKKTTVLLIMPNFYGALKLFLMNKLHYIDENLPWDFLSTI